jgi:hypothetical protein
VIPDVVLLFFTSTAERVPITFPCPTWQLIANNVVPQLPSSFVQTTFSAEVEKENSNSGIELQL